jgi:hypothetical protein
MYQNTSTYTSLTISTPGANVINIYGRKYIAYEIYMYICGFSRDS